MVDYKHILYKNHLGPTKILITESCSGKFPSRETYANNIEIYNVHIWIHNNVIKKLHKELGNFKEGNELSNENIIKLFSNN